MFQIKQLMYLLLTMSFMFLSSLDVEYSLFLEDWNIQNFHSNVSEGLICVFVCILFWNYYQVQCVFSTPQIKKWSYY